MNSTNDDKNGVDVMKAGVRGAGWSERHNFNWLCVNGLCCQCHL